jgi:glutamate-1-semialdehyde 2,1-aminomutase
VGTFNGNPVALAAARASLTEVLASDAYEHLDSLEERLLRGCQEVIDRHGLPGYAVGIGAKGCVTFSPEPIVDYDSFKAHQDPALADLAWLYNMNRRVYMTPGREEEWTLTVAHTQEDCDAFVASFEEMAADLTA